MARPLRTLLLYACTDDNSTFSYQRAWPRHFARHPAFACESINVGDRSAAARLRLEWSSRTFSGDLIVILHSVFSNALMLPPRILDRLAQRPQPKAYFIGNEYKLMPEKVAFCERVGVSLLVSQSLSPTVHDLYQQRLNCAVTGVPNTGLDTEIFRPASEPDTRPVDLGYRAADAPWYLGHRERRDIAEFFAANADRYGVTVDISLDAADRLDEIGWAAYLNRCKGQLGSEAGGDYFDLEDHSRHAVEAFLEAHPEASFEDVRSRFFPPAHPHVPLRILSGRHVEAAGTKTAQVLMAGRYDGLFVADEHYIPFDRDFSDIDEAMRKFADRSFREDVAERAYRLVREQLTYERLVDRFYVAVTPLVS
jgi:hypothetical protein